jgi:hypothetical protein
MELFKKIEKMRISNDNPTTKLKITSYKTTLKQEKKKKKLKYYIL